MLILKLPKDESVAVKKSQIFGSIKFRAHHEGIPINICRLSFGPLKIYTLRRGGKHEVDQIV